MRKQIMIQFGLTPAPKNLLIALVLSVTTWLTQAIAEPKPGKTFKDCAACPVMLPVPAGHFVMGSAAGGPELDETPAHRVTFARPFAMGQFELTWAEWEPCVLDHACVELSDAGYGRGQRPVVNVSWDEANTYARWLSLKAGQRYRLPSEAEWEYAARGDPNVKSTCDFANVRNSSLLTARDLSSEAFSCEDGYNETAPVGRFKPNRFGLYDLIGNVWEWVADCPHDDYRGAPGDGRVWSGGDCGRRGLRGGAWNSVPSMTRSTFRYSSETNSRSFDSGFRLVRELP